tara:strand:+ start:735 stop:1709 length:975 start_codon:yes stop_codon:yes gene_type:complete
MNFSKRIIRWQKLNGRNNLPWQTNDPYKVWISEIMLQQTQVSTVIPYYENFIQSFPDILTLSKSDLDEVLNNWAGLGFYRRARNLHQTSKIIANKYNQVFPDNYDDLVDLPGIGESTAGAILALAFNKAGTILDGNVKRVVSRYLNVENNPSELKKTIKPFLYENSPEDNYRRFGQGMMDLGSLTCIKDKPKCNKCPIQKKCLSFKKQSFIKTKKNAIAKTQESFSWFIYQKNNKVMLCKNPDEGIWPNLWVFPKRELFRTRQNVNELPSFKHSLSHKDFHISPRIINIPNDMETSDEKTIWIEKNKIAKLGAPKPVLDIVKKF